MNFFIFEKKIKVKADIFEKIRLLKASLFFSVKKREHQKKLKRAQVTDIERSMTKR